MNLIYMRNLTSTNTVRAALPTIANVGDVRHTHDFTRLGLELFHCISTIESLTDFFKSGASRLDEVEVDRHKLNDQPAFEEEVEPPATRLDSKRNGVLRQEQTDACRKTLQEQTVCTDLEAKNFEWV